MPGGFPKIRENMKSDPLYQMRNAIRRRGEEEKKAQRRLLVWSLIGAALLLLLIVVWVGKAPGQTASFEAQWTYGQEPDVAGFHLFWGSTSGTYALGYDMPVAQYVAPPGWMNIPVALSPDDYYFVVTAYDTAGNESLYSEEATMTVQNTVPPSACQGLKLRVPVP